MHMKPDAEKRKMLLVVDPQVDFIDGTLAVDGARAAIDSLVGRLNGSPGAYSAVIVTVDWHPWRHCSFIGCGGTWPRHCVAYSPGAAVDAALLRALNDTQPAPVILTKGTDENREEYSIFGNSRGARTIAGIVRALALSDVDVCGIAGDICVRATVLDALDALPGVRINLLTDAIASLDGGAAVGELAARLHCSQSKN